MRISSAGLNIIKEFEGYHEALPDGGCKAYQIRYRGKLDVPTIGWGCTEGVRMGMVWTREQAETALRREVAKFEAGVDRLVTVHLNQNQFDALVSFAYNVGLGALERSTLRRKLNAGDYDGAANAFAAWNKVGKYAEKGLTRRRAAEATLFRTPAGSFSIPAADPPKDAPKKSVPKAIKESPSLRMQVMSVVMLIGGAITDGFNTVFDTLWSGLSFIPVVGSEVSQFMAPAEQVAGSLQIPWAKISLWFAVFCIIACTIRQLPRKRAGQ